MCGYLCNAEKEENRMEIPLHEDEPSFDAAKTAIYADEGKSPDCPAIMGSSYRSEGNSMKRYILFSINNRQVHRKEFKSYPKAFAAMKEQFTKEFVKMMDWAVHSAEMDPDHRLIETEINQRSMYLYVTHTGDRIGFKIEEW